MLQNIAQTRSSAFLIHLAFSAVIALTIILTAIMLWYPDHFLELTGAKKIFLMIVLIDVCIGPILTLIVFNKSKPELGRDLTIIFIIQLCALFYGMYTVTVARPVYVVFAVDRFELVQANDISKKSLSNATDKQFKNLPLFSPKWVIAKQPINIKEKEDLLFGSVDTGYDLAQLPKYYTHYDETNPTSVKEVMKNRILPLELLKQYNLHRKEDVAKLIKHFSNKKMYGYLPLTGKKGSLTVIMNMETNQPIEISTLKPWSE